MANVKQATSLIREMITRDGYSLPPYNEEVVRVVIADIQAHNDQMTRLDQEAREAARQQAVADEDFDWATQPERFAGVIVHHEAIIRLKRILMTYNKMRMDCLSNIRWEHRHLPQEVRDNLAPAEIECYREYDKAINKFMGMGREGIGMDLTLDMTPPKDAAVTVKVLKDHGNLATSTCANMRLKRGSVHTLQRSEAEPLIRLGVLQPLQANY